jgi:hypothetical protein
MSNFFQAWRRRQAELQAAEWTEEREETRLAVEELPDALRNQVRLAVETLIEGRDEDVKGALEDLDHALERIPSCASASSRFGWSTTPDPFSAGADAYRSESVSFRAVLKKR